MQRPRSTFQVLFAILLTFGSVASLARAQDKSPASIEWTGWLGPNRDGWVDHFVAPTVWPKQLKQAWQAEVGIGYATPLVANGFVYQYGRMGEEEVLTCFQLETGKQQWQSRYEVPFTMGQGGEWHGKGPKGSPILDNGRLFTLSISGILTAWNAEDGKQIWQRDYNERFAKPKSTPYWGATTSPIVDGKQVIVHFGNDQRGVLAALDVETGNEIWSQPRDAPSYSSPLLIEKSGVRQLLEWNHRAVVGIDLGTGRQLWEYPFPHVETNQNMPTPAWKNGRVYVGGENRGVRCVEPTLAGSDWSAREVWQQKDVALDMATAVINGDYLYGLSHFSKGRLFCLELATGDIVWQSKPRVGDNATFLAIPGHVVVLTDRGKLQFYTADGADTKQVASYEVSEEATWAAPVLLESGVLIKDHDKLTRWSF